MICKENKLLLLGEKKIKVYHYNILEEEEDCCIITCSEFKGRKQKIKAATFTVEWAPQNKILYIDTQSSLIDGLHYLYTINLHFVLYVKTGMNNIKTFEMQ